MVDERKPTKGMRSESVRTANLGEVVRVVHQQGPLTRSEICVATGLTRSSVAVQVGELVEAGIVAERSASSRGKPGRPSTVVGFESGVAALGVDIGVDSCAVGVYRLGGEEAGVERTVVGASTEPDHVVDLVARIAQKAVADAGSPQIVGVGVGVPGLVDDAGGNIAIAPNLDWRDVPLGSLLEGRLGLPARVFVGNEANLSAFAESIRGAGSTSDDMIYVSGEVGVGGGVISAGSPLRGRSGFAGEIGHIAVNPDGRACGCGSTGCWETEIGIRSVLERAGIPVDGASAADELWDRARRGDAVVLNALTETGRWLGVGVSMLVNIFNPDVVVFGGMYRNGFPHLIEAVRSEMHTRVLAPLRGAAVVPSELGDNAILVGAAELAFSAMLADPLKVIFDSKT